MEKFQCMEYRKISSTFWYKSQRRGPLDGWGIGQCKLTALVKDITQGAWRTSRCVTIQQGATVAF